MKLLLIFLFIPFLSKSQGIKLKGIDKVVTVEAPVKNSLLQTTINGREAIQFILNATDRNVGGSKRTELGYPFWQGKKEQTVTFGLFAPASYEKDEIINSICDFHSMPDTALGETWTASPIVMFIQNDTVWMQVMWSSLPVNSFKGGVTDTDERPIKYNVGVLNKEVWTDWKIHVVFGYDKRGVLQVWKNNKLLVNRVNMPNSYNDKTPPSFKFGLYIWDWANKKIVPKVKQRIIYFSDPTIY